MDEQVKPRLTLPDVWAGGHYALKLCLGSASEAQLQAALEAIWRYPELRGPFAYRNKEPLRQAILPVDAPHDQLFGAMRIRDKFVPCGTIAVREEDDLGERTADFITHYSPMGALSQVFPVGSYPFGSWDAAPEWRAEVDGWFLEMLRSQREVLSFEVGKIGFEVEMNAMRAGKLKSGRMPAERFDGIVIPGENEIEWYPPTRFDLFHLQ